MQASRSEMFISNHQQYGRPRRHKQPYAHAQNFPRSSSKWRQLVVGWNLAMFIRKMNG